MESKSKSESFPIKWKCRCGSEERLSQRGWEKTHPGKVNKETHWGFDVYTMILPGDFVKKAIVVHYDICCACGRTYAFLAEMTTGVEILPNIPPFKPGPPGRGSMEYD